MRARIRRDLDAELLGALGRGRLQRERTEALAHLVLEVARALDLSRDAGELELGAVAAALETAEPRGLLDELAPLGRLRREHRLDPALRDDRAQPAAEPDVGQQLDQVDAADRRPVDEVLPLPAPVQPPRDRDLGERQLAEASVLVVEDELDLAEVGRAAAPAEPAKRTSSGFSARSSCGESDAGRPEDRVGDVRLAGAVRADDHGDARLEPDLDRVHERLEPAKLDRVQVHARRG